MIEVKNLYKSFKGHVVHSGVTFEVKKGEILTIMGGSGAGKSILLKQIVGLIKPDHGTISIDGKEISRLSEYKLQEVQKMIGYVFQEAALFDSLTVGENVAFGLFNVSELSPTKIEEITKEKLALVGLPGIENLKPAQLSGGMKKRVGIARAIAMSPQILLYDEPTTGLDPVMSDVINDLILKLKKETQMTAIAVTHDMKSAYKISDRMAMLYQGKLLQVGTPTEIRNSKNGIVQQFVTGSSIGPIPIPGHASNNS